MISAVENGECWKGLQVYVWGRECLHAVTCQQAPWQEGGGPWWGSWVV